jgi:hypothetical protein
VPERHYGKPAKNGRSRLSFLFRTAVKAFRGCRLQLVCRPQRVIRSKPGHRTVQSHRERSSGTTHDYRKDYLLPSKNNLEGSLDLDLRSLMKAIFLVAENRNESGKILGVK